MVGGARPWDLYFSPGSAPLPALRNQALTEAWDKLNGEVSDSAEWLVTVLQRQQAINMAVARAMQFARFVNALRRGRFGDAHRALHIDARDPRVQEAERRARRHLGRNKTQQRLYGEDDRFSNFDKRIGSAVLEYNFGWAPMLGDIYSTMDLLQSEIPLIPVKGKGTATATVNYRYADGWWVTSGPITYRMRAALCGDLQVTNPNLFLADRLGLLNPAIVLYETTPWSFVANWFVNIETMIRAWSPHWGFQWTNATTTFSLYSESDIVGSTPWGTAGYGKILRFSQTRSTGLQKPRLGFRQQKLVLSRLANAVSLVIQRLRK